MPAHHSLASLIARAAEWEAQDPDPETRAELSALVSSATDGDAAAVTALASAFDGTLQFATAGLRAALGPGSNRMNRVVVARTAAGLATYLLARGESSVVIGYDARSKSEAFARDVAEILAGAGLEALLLPSALPTPVLVFALRHLGCAAAVMVTASHNPATDNGLKVYVDGAPIIPPVDADIAACIDAVASVPDLPRSSDYRVLDDEVLAAYVRHAVSLLGDGPRAVRAVYTPMHGVGGTVFEQAVTAAGFPAPQRVAAQFDPDGTFPTAPFPNPEEPGAMDLALEQASQSEVDVIVGHDPDADRCAAGIPDGDGWRMLTGDELGVVLGWWVVQRRRASGLGPGVFASSIVSGSMLASIADAAGYRFERTLTGFKWIARVPGLVYGYEEALGYCVDPAAVTDKDGITAALLFLELAAHLKASGRTIPGLLDALATEHGVHATSQVSVRVSDVALIQDLMVRLREQPPSSLGVFVVDEVDDLARGYRGLPPTDGLRLGFAGGWVVVRPSGTEPKVKCYLEISVPVTAGLPAAKEEAARGMAELRDAVSSLVAMA